MGKAKAILISIGIILCSYLLVLFFSGSVTMADAYRGYEAMHQFQNGGEWNTLNYPAITKTSYSTYISWWAPGHWMLPWLLISCGLQSMQTIQFLLIAISLTIAIYGYYRLFQELNFSRLINLLSILCIVTNATFYWQTLMYHGGELFFTAVLPYFVYFLIRLKKYSMLQKVIMFAGFALFGLFLKNTFFILLICAGAFILFYQDDKTLKDRLKSFWPLALTFFIISIPFYVFHLGISETPSTAVDMEGYFNIPNSYLGDFVYAFGSPINIFTRFSFLSHRINNVLFSDMRYFNFLHLIPLVLAGIFYIRSFKRRKEVYHALLIYVCLPFFAAFTIFYIQDKAVSYEMRHFAAIGFLFFPGILQWIKESKYVQLIGIVVLLLCIMDIGIYTQQVKAINENHVLWNELKVPKEDGVILSVIEKWDAQHVNGLILFEDYWQLSIGQSKNDKMVVAIDDNKVRVVSGMELDHPDYVPDINMLIQDYDYILLVGRIKPKVKLMLNDIQWKSSISTERFQLVSADL